jgi:hypothetical protein
MVKLEGNPKFLSEFNSDCTQNHQRHDYLHQYASYIVFFCTSQNRQLGWDCMRWATFRRLPL